MVIGGLEKLSLIDYPGELAAVVFTQGCNFRCPFCHNPMLVQASYGAGKIKNNRQYQEKGEGHTRISEDDLLSFLEERRGKLDGVVVTGGEPTIHADLGDFLGKIKELGYRIKLDTNGSNPEALGRILRENKADYLAMDFKGPPERYPDTTGVALDFSYIQKSVTMIMQSGLPYEFRTTLVPGYIKKRDIKKMGEIIQGADKWFLQRFISHVPLLDDSLRNTEPFSEEEMEEMKKIARKYVNNAELR